MSEPNIRLMPLEWLQPYAKNAKLHPPEEIKRLAATIKRFGWDQPIVAEADGTIIKGHGRRLAAIELGLDTVPVWIRSDLSRAEADAARIADNAAFGMRYDTALMQEELRRLMAEAPEISLDDLALTDKDRTLLTEQLDRADADAILDEMDSEIERQKKEDAERVENADAEMVPLAKAFGFGKIRKSDERVLMSFMAEAEAATGKEGYEAFIGGLKLAAERGFA
jgi:ParB-like chromosome segregation protein Spo0J